MDAYTFKVLEPAILEFWKQHDTYHKAKLLNAGKKSFYWLQGPPYTSGDIHVGHAWNTALKDVVLRYKRMKGFDVWDRAGYDMHGLPTELKVQKKLSIASKEDIPQFGIARFVEECKQFSVQNMQKMNADFQRLGAWMDFANAYQPISPEYIEGEWWLIKKAHEQGRLYEGEKVMHWCASCATSLAKHELEYEQVADTSIFVKFPVKGKPNMFLLIWTTTPWTIPFNLGVMVNPELEYIEAKVDDQVWIVAKGLAAPVIQAVADKTYTILNEFKGDALQGLEYTHPFSSFIDYAALKQEHQNVHTIVLSKEYVDLSAGTGLVHMAPGSGPEDYEVGKKNNIPPFNTLDEYGVFPKSMGKFAGFTARKDDKRFIAALQETGLLLATTPVEHDYAHCWRCKSGVIFRTTKQWFFKVEDLKERMKELNKHIHWVPEWAGSRQFHSWLDNLRDNAITRQRYWGTPLPIWRCASCQRYTVIGSLAELEKKAGKIPADLHRPYIDEVILACSCGREQRRIPDILDVWIDSGTASWNCLGYPRQDKLFKRLFPPDFILEGNDQIRGWFNLLFVSSMVAMQQLAFKAVYMHGFVNDALGRKMSKSLGNIISPHEVFEQYGADSFRLYATQNRAGNDLNYNMEDIKSKQRNLTVLWNIAQYFLDLIKQHELKEPASFGVEEQYILSRLNTTILQMTEHLDVYEIDCAPGLVEEFFLELSRTYIQSTREKLLTAPGTVLFTVAHCLKTALALLAPICPFITEQIYQQIKPVLKLHEASVHHLEWPIADKQRINTKLEKQFAAARQIIQAVLSGREKMQLGVRWPIPPVLLVTSDKEMHAAAASLKELIASQANAKGLELVEDVPGIKMTVSADYGKIGPDFGNDAPLVIAHIASASATTILQHIKGKGKYSFTHNGKRFEIVPEHIIVKRSAPDHLVEVPIERGFVYLDKRRTEELESEGFARELMRRIQALRKQAGLHKSDKILLHITADEPAFLKKWEQQIQEKVNAKQISLSDAKPAMSYSHQNTEKIKYLEFVVSLQKV
ncbi:isoleucine--tRNA ligase [Candidatus Woesearchaeota archaeon]|nr:isoleucine--tRNA ligase [Candidatus Woesearchaeota archaeon]